MQAGDEPLGEKWFVIEATFFRRSIIARSPLENSEYIRRLFSDPVDAVRRFKATNRWQEAKPHAWTRYSYTATTSVG